MFFFFVPERGPGRRVARSCTISRKDGCGGYWYGFLEREDGRMTVRIWTWLWEDGGKGGNAHG